MSSILPTGRNLKITSFLSFLITIQCDPEKRRIIYSVTIPKFTSMRNSPFWVGHTVLYFNKVIQTKLAKPKTQTHKLTYINVIRFIWWAGVTTSSQTYIIYNLHMRCWCFSHMKLGQVLELLLRKNVIFIISFLMNS